MKAIAPLLALLLAIVVYTGAHAQSDTAAPVIVDVTLDPSFIDTSTGKQTITVTAHITDDVSGFEWAELQFRPEIGTTQLVSALFYDSSMIEGSLVDGIYRCAMTLPQYAAWGRWRVTLTFTKDRVGNYVFRQDQPGLSTWHFINGRDTEYLYLPALRKRTF